MISCRRHHVCHHFKDETIHVVQPEQNKWYEHDNSITGGVEREGPQNEAGDMEPTKNEINMSGQTLKATPSRQGNILEKDQKKVTTYANKKRRETTSFWNWDKWGGKNLSGKCSNSSRTAMRFHGKQFEEDELLKAARDMVTRTQSVVEH